MQARWSCARSHAVQMPRKLHNPSTQLAAASLASCPSSEMEEIKGHMITKVTDSGNAEAISSLKDLCETGSPVVTEHHEQALKLIASLQEVVKTASEMQTEAMTVLKATSVCPGRSEVSSLLPMFVTASSSLSVPGRMRNTSWAARMRRSKQPPSRTSRCRR